MIKDDLEDIRKRLDKIEKNLEQLPKMRGLDKNEDCM